MKALEKAARDRGESRPKQPEPELMPGGPAAEANEPKLQPPAAEPVPPPPGMSPIPTPDSELTLEPLGAPMPRPAAGAPKAPPPIRGEPPPRERAPGPAQAAPKPSAEQDRAATVLQASRSPAGGAGAYVRTHPVVVFGALAGLFAIGFGIYIYLQIFDPGFFVRQAAAPTVPPRQAQAPAQAPATTPAPLPTAPLLQGPAAGGSTAPAAAAKPVPPVRAPLTASAPQPQGQPEPVAPRNTIVVSPGRSAPTIDPLLTDAYAALTTNRVETAQDLYERLLKKEPRNIDALLGLAALALRAGRSDDATQRYLQILELEPRNALAQSGLIALLGRADPLAAESRLKQLIAREPSAHLYFTLGNLYADQSLWAQAQHAYFQAHHLESANPDYAYNLAVGLEHVGQRKLALEFYQRAVALAATRPQVNFEIARAQERVSKLAEAAK